MKKIITLSLMLLAFTFVNAQDETSSKNFKQSTGDKGLELEFDPGAIFNASNGSNIFSNGLGINFKMFQSEDIALRLNMNISFFNTSTITQDADDDLDLEELKDKNRSLEFILNPGIEKHFAGTKRLSPYVGAQATLGFQTSTLKQEAQFGSDVETLKTKNANFGDGLHLGVGALAGANFFIAKKLYLGVELGYGLNYFMAFKTKITTTVDGVDDVETKVGKDNTLRFEPNAMGEFRIGFLF